MKNFMINFKKITISLILFIFIISSFVYVKAFEGNFSNFESGNEIEDVTNVVDDFGGTVISLMRIVSVTIALVMLLVIAMKYMLASPGDKADIKKHAIAYVVGAFILFGVTGILTILTNFANVISVEETGG